jgi:hypothetical protein
LECSGQPPYEGVTIEVLEPWYQLLGVSFCASGIVGMVSVGLHDLLNGVIGNPVSLQILFDCHTTSLSLARALFGEIVCERLVIDEAGFAEARHHLPNGVAGEPALAQAVLDFTLATWAELKEPNRRLLGPVIGISGNKLGNLRRIKRLAHEETFVGQGVKAHPQGELAVDDEVDSACVTGLGANRRNRAGLWITILRRCHRRHPELPLSAR